MNIFARLYRPRRLAPSGDDTPAAGLRGYIWRMTGRHQVVAGVVAVLVALLNLAPIELQRRIVNEVVDTRQVDLLVQLGVFYFVLLVVHQAVKYGLHMYQVWLSESTAILTRRHLIRLYSEQGADGDSKDNDTDDQRGRVVSIVNSEVEKLSGYVGEAISQAFANGALLIGVLAYMCVVEPSIAFFALAFMVPQIVITPLMQRKLNALVEERVTFVRKMGDRVGEVADGDLEPGEDGPEILKDIYDNRIRFTLLKFALKGALNLLSAFGPLAVLIYGGYLVMQGETQVGVIVAFISGFERINSPVRELVAFYRMTEQARVQHEMVAKWMSKVLG